MSTTTWRHRTSTSTTSSPVYRYLHPHSQRCSVLWWLWSVIFRGFLVGHTLVLDCSTTSRSFECRRSGYWFVSYLWHYTFRDADFPLFSGVIFSGCFWPYFIFLFLNFLSLFVFIFCETARTCRFSVVFAKVQWHLCTLVAPPLDAWGFRLSAGTGWPSVTGKESYSNL